ncbi:MAG: dihydrofolate reductase, partial [Muribaculaceae bacterium]|nr:dihydrofolate reductase [Muribaculaceae bacterium]
MFNSEVARLRSVTAIVAMARDNAIGRAGSLPWRLPEDMAHFKAFTMGHPIIMGRKTWESLPKRPLPGRRNIVVSRSPLYEAEGAEVFPSVEA